MSDELSKSATPKVGPEICPNCGYNIDHQTRCCRELAEARAERDKYKRLCEGMWDVLDRIAVYENPWKGHPHQNTCERLQELAKEALAAYEEAVK